MSETRISNAVVEGCSGSLGSVLALLATYPLKTIYTLQALSTGETKGAPAAQSDAGTRFVAALRFIQTYKLSNLYAGLGPNVVESALSSGVYFFFYSKLRDQAVQWSRRNSKDQAGGGSSRSGDVGVLASLLVATTAGALNQLITMPASVVATRMQGYRSLPGASASKRPPNTWETIAAVFREDGLGGFWKGLLPSMILLANPAVQYMLFEKIKTVMKYWKAQRVAARQAATTAAAAAAARSEVAAAVAGDVKDRRRSADSDHAMEAAEEAAPPKASRVTVTESPAAAAPGNVPQLSALEVFLAGALAKIGATVATYPLIVVKARMQASSSAPGPGGALSSGGSTWSVISATARNEGLGGFFKGLRAKILQTALNAALMLMLKEQLHSVTRSALCLAAPTAVQEAAVKAAASATASPS